MKHRTKRLLIIVPVVFILCCGLGLFGLRLLCIHLAKQTGVSAMQHYSGNYVQALIAQALNPKEDPEKRTRAVWALGMLEVYSAHNALQTLVTNKECDHKTSVCQYELRKALAKTRVKK